MLKDMIVPITSAIIAITGVLSGVWVQHSANSQRMKEKEFEITFIKKQEGYASVVRLLGECEKNLLDDDRNLFAKNIVVLQSQYLSLEPFLRNKVARDAGWKVLVLLRNAPATLPPAPKGGTAAMDPKALKQVSDQMDETVQRIREFLYTSLFESNE
jgi:hypothetical protein